MRQITQLWQREEALLRWEQPQRWTNVERAEEKAA
jgi:hypothetical protein